MGKNDAWHAIYQTREHEETVISKVSNISFKATCFCYNENTSEAEAERGRGQSQVIKRLVLFFGTDQIHSIIPSSELVNLIYNMLIVKVKKQRPEAIWGRGRNYLSWRSILVFGTYCIHFQIPLSELMNLICNMPMLQIDLKKNMIEVRGQEVRVIFSRGHFCISYHILICNAFQFIWHLLFKIKRKTTEVKTVILCFWPPRSIPIGLRPKVD